MIAGLEDDGSVEAYIDARIREGLEVVDDVVADVLIEGTVPFEDAVDEVGRRLEALSEVGPGEAKAAVGSALEAAIASSDRARSILAGLTEKAKGPTILVAPKTIGRITGWVIVCPNHGARDVAAPSMSAAVAEAARHLEEHHNAAGDIKRGRPVRGGRRG